MTPTAQHERGLELARNGQLREAETVFRDLLEADPADADALHFFAVLAGRKGNVEEAEALLDRVVQSRPDWGKAWNNLGRIYQTQGRLDEAVAALEKAARLNADDVECLRDYGLVLIDIGDLAGALVTFEAAVRLDPGSADILTDLAAVLTEMSRESEAEEACRRAIGIDPRHAEAHSLLGTIRRRQNRYDEAEASARQAITLDPGVGGYRCNLAILLRNAGRDREAVAEFRRAVELDPLCTQAYRMLATLTALPADDPLLPRMESLLERDEIGLQGRIDVHFALARALEQQRSYADAFRHLEAGNRLKRSTMRYDDADREGLVRQVIDIFDRDMIERHRDAGNPSDRPIFILGMPRSGTTLVEQIIASHSAVTACGELTALGRLAQAAGYPSAFRAVDPKMWQRIGDAYLAQAQPAGGRRFTDKMPENFLHIGLIRLILPNARIVHCRRDPVDTCLSCYRQFFAGPRLPFAYDLQELGLEYRRYVRLMDHWRAVLPEAILEVQYEALVADQEGETRRLLAFCGLPFEEGCLRYYEADRVVDHANAAQVRQPIQRTALDRWKKYEDHLAPLLRTLSG